MNDIRVASRYIKKPWGSESIWATAGSYAAKVLRIDDGESLSEQYHVVKEETLLVVYGVVRVVWGGSLVYYGGVPSVAGAREETFHSGESFHLPPGVVHTISACGGEAMLVEVSTPELDDVVRLSDKYGRSSGDR